MRFSKIICLLVFAFSKICSAQQEQLIPLKLKTAETVKLEAGQVFKYIINLKQGQFASIKVHQKSVGIGYAVYAPGDSLIINEDLNAIYQTEVINIAAAKSGNYRVEIFWDYGRPQNGEYRIVWDILEPVGKTPVLRAGQLMKSWYSATEAGAAVVILKKGKIIYKNTTGLANMEYKIPISANSAFELASCSKQFTGFAIAMLLGEGKIFIEDDIRKYLPELSNIGQKITLENLIYHTSGLRNWDAMSNSMGFRPEDVLTTDMMYKMICNSSELNFTPNEKFSYTNTGYNLLALIVERVTNQPFGKWMADNIFTPLGMKNTFLKDDIGKIIPNKVYSYKKGENGFSINPDNFSLMGSTSLYSSIDDLVAWVTNFETKKVGSKKTHELLNRTTKYNNGKILDFYAFGNGFGSYKGVSNIQHLGLVSGFRTAISRYPEQNLVIIFLANDNNDATFAHSLTIADIFLENIKNKALEPINFPDLKETLENTLPKTMKCPVDTKEYEGIYYADEINSHYKLINRNGILTAVSYRFDEIELKWEKTDIFSANFKITERSFEFLRNNDKVISAFKLTGIDREIVFYKVR
jgi:CubicO group peptidase (beta-lactamase class C family)